MKKISIFIDQLEQISIAICLAIMVLITFINVIARYVFSSSILWGVEITVFLFAWLVFMGMSYGIKNHFHIGVDIIIVKLPPLASKITALVAVSCCLLFAIILLLSAWEYWYPFINKRAFLETQDIPMPDFLMFLSTWFNGGEAYEKLPRFIPYLTLPLGAALLVFRLLEQAWLIITNKNLLLIQSHQ